MKGITNIEFILAVIIFLSTISFVSLSIINKIPNIHTISVGENVKASSYYMSDMIIFDKGDPVNWDTMVPGNINDIKRIGLSSSEPYIIDKGKFGNFTYLCNNNKEKIRELFGNFVFEIKAIDSNGGSGAFYFTCKTTAPVIELVVRRAAVMNYDGLGLKPVLLEVISG